MKEVNGGAGEKLGFSTALSNDGLMMALGAPGAGAGFVRVYDRSNKEAEWIQLGDDIDGEAAGDNFGRSLSLAADGQIVAIGAIYNDGNGLNSGHVRLFGLSGTTWVQLGDDIDGEAAGDYFGWSVSLAADGQIVAIGAPRNDGNGGDSGHVRLFGWSGTTWVQLGDDIDGEATWDNFGSSVSLAADGQIVAIGAPYNDGNGGSSGHVRTYQVGCL
jgi:hypothetical protein